MNYELDSYWYVALACAAVAFFIVSQYLISQSWNAFKLYTGGKRALKRMRNLKPGEPVEPQPAASFDFPVQPDVEANPIVKNREASEFQPEASMKPPALTGAEVEPMREYPELLEVDPAAGPELASQAEAEVSRSEAWPR